MGKLLQCSDTGVLDNPAPDPAGTLDDNGGDHDGDSGDAELQDHMFGIEEVLDTLEADLAK